MKTLTAIFAAAAILGISAQAWAHGGNMTLSSPSTLASSGQAVKDGTLPPMRLAGGPGCSGLEGLFDYCNQ